VVEAGASTVNIPDTVGYAVPEEYGRIFSHLREQLPQLDEEGVVLSCHCHNDLGMAVANSLAAVGHGARQIECTINGIGERAGNASLEEIVMALRTRGDYFRDYVVEVDASRIYPVSRMVSTFTGLFVQRNKAVVGENAFAHEAGIHQDGVLKERTTYEIMDPRDIGIPESKLVLGKHSGRHAFRNRVTELGFAVDEELVGRAFEAFKALADKKKSVYDEDIEALIEHELGEERHLWELERFQVLSGTELVATATVTLRDSAGHVLTDASTGDGPIDAIYSAIQRITGVNVTLRDYRTRAVTEGKDAQGEVTVEVDHHGHLVRGRGLSTDVVEGAARAYIAAINRIKLPPEAEPASPATSAEPPVAGTP
jgi:2-isopropylmalate synthase